MAKPLCIDLFAGLGGWAEGFLAEGWDVVGFDIERHVYGDQKYPAQLILQDVLTLHGSQFRNAAVIVASPPCQAYSKRAMPFGGLWLEHNRMDDDGGPPGNYRGKDPIFNDLFLACFRIAREAGVPIIVENVKGAQKFVGRAKWHYGSYYLWGDVPALMPTTLRERKSQHDPLCETPEGTGKTSWFFGNSKHEARHYGVKCAGQKHGTEYAMTRGRLEKGIKQRGSGAEWFDGPLNERRLVKNTAAAHRADMIPMLHQGKTTNNTRKAASAQIAKIPFPLSSHIARVFKP